MAGETGNQARAAGATPPVPPVARVRIDLMGETMVIRGSTSEEYIRELAAELNQRIQIATSKHNGESRIRILLLVALNLMDELRQMRTEKAQLQRLLEEVARTPTSRNHNASEGA
ncbi:MAG: cell division protein ZapA [Limnochordales bacterium]|nr:cell division protein ZapA [Limnochordales bacterium]